jgi:hypothetical protein
MHDDLHIDNTPFELFDVKIKWLYISQINKIMMNK